MNDSAAVAFRQVKARQNLHRQIVGDSWPEFGENGPLVFTTEYGEPLDAGQVLKQLHALLAPIGMPKFRFHDFRHGSTTLMIREGVSILAVSKILGHSTTTTTMNIYAHVADEAVEEAMRSLDRRNRRRELSMAARVAVFAANDAQGSGCSIL